MTMVTIERRVDWQDTDAAGHYHHGSAIRWVEAAEAALLERFGLSELFGRTPRVRYEVDYVGRLWFGDTVSIELSVGRLGTSSLRYDFAITRIPGSVRPAATSTEPTLALRGSLTAVHTPDNFAGAQPWPANVVAALTGQAPADAAPTPIQDI
ncbi:acyl-CoA thioesterase [Nocardia paucivorans]|uniref:acyl-CoA thioesterase n=1 Tax=Nocardia paucivorans TaxID=114259 RepID=UPI0002EA728A|nr:thioesterase family protein [Nocardia paucivorans]